ncbi:unnamed protein product [Clavelina lepadiformis]|uniref:Uncharacterized protein n=1 Tax=Clavelina lepadiformis TaxID=159417 RepID=A0ABP0EXW0_CLALP
MNKRKKALLQILKEDFLLFTMVTLKSIPLAGKFRNSQKRDRRFPPLHDGDLEIDPPLAGKFRNSQKRDRRFPPLHDGDMKESTWNVKHDTN